MSGKGSSIAAGKGQTFILTCREQKEDAHHHSLIYLFKRRLWTHLLVWLLADFL